jgi:predicted nucleic acid-binding protein
MDVAVLDTTITSILFEKKPATALYAPHLTGKSLTICFQTVAEMRYGALKAGWGTHRAAALETFLSTFYLVPYSDQLAHSWAEVMLDAQRIGRRLEAGDAWIAATARRLSAPLFTDDKDLSPEACPSITIYRFRTP